MLVTTQLMALIDFFFLLWKSMDTNQLFDNQHSLKYLNLCSTEERNSYMFGLEQHEGE